jgi:hypothetical protein
MTYDLTNPIYSDEEKARAHFQALRWPDGPICPHCGVIGNATEMKGATTRPGLFKCREKECRKPFTATMGTVYERSHIPLHKWLLATHLICASKKGMSALQLFRMLGFGSYKTAWFMAHRIREAMTDKTQRLNQPTIPTSQRDNGLGQGRPVNGGAACQYTLRPDQAPRVGITIERSPLCAAESTCFHRRRF